MEFLSTILNIILFLVMLGVLITIHELGHFIAAKIFRVYVFEFAIGFGPKIFRKKKGETYYSLRALPLGGYVAMLGEEDAVPDEFVNEEIPKERSLIGINRGKRALIMSAGIIMNLVLGYAIFLFANGVLPQTGLSIRLEVKEDSPVYAMGIRSDDRIDFKETKIDGYTIQYFGEGKLDAAALEPEYYVLFQPKSLDDLTFGGESLVLLKIGATDLASENSFYTDLKDTDVLTFTATFLRGETYETAERIEKVLTLSTEPKNPDKLTDGYKFVSAGFNLTKFKYRNNFSETFTAANKDFIRSVTAVARGLKSLFSDGLKNISGPVGIFNISSQTLKNHGLAPYLFLWGLISINLALFNLLPFPPLDGWHLLVVTVEAITRQEISPKFKQIASMIGAILLIGLTLVILAKDIFGFVGVIL